MSVRVQTDREGANSCWLLFLKDKKRINVIFFSPIFLFLFLRSMSDVSLILIILFFSTGPFFCSFFIYYYYYYFITLHYFTHLSYNVTEVQHNINLFSSPVFFLFLFFFFFCVGVSVFLFFIFSSLSSIPIDYCLPILFYFSY